MIMITYHNKNDRVSSFFITNSNNISIFHSYMNNSDGVL